MAEEKNGPPKQRFSAPIAISAKPFPPERKQALSYPITNLSFHQPAKPYNKIHDLSFSNSFGHEDDDPPSSLANLITKTCKLFLTEDVIDTFIEFYTKDTNTTEYSSVTIHDLFNYINSNKNKMEDKNLLILTLIEKVLINAFPPSQEEEPRCSLTSQ